MPRNIAIIPARGGSKRLPRKNILPINGKPMISYPILAAINSGLFDEVVVSTEDKEISTIAASFGATVSKRFETLAQDRSTVVQVCEDVLEKDDYKTVESFCCIYATAIFITPEDIINSFKLITNKPPVDYVMGISGFNYHPVQALNEVGGYLQSMWPEYNDKQSQFYPHLVVSNGTLYWAKRTAFMRDKTFYGERLVGYQLDSDHTVDIDTPEDYESAKMLAKDILPR